MKTLNFLVRAFIFLCCLFNVADIDYQPSFG